MADEEEEEEEELTEATKLKGVFWPGMDIFDAATPETKRKRNQKKHTSVAVSLERHSLFVEPTEMVFTPLGTHRKSRPITGQVDLDSSPYRLDIPTPKPKRRLSKNFLVDKDVNAPLNQKRHVVPFRGLGPISNANLANATTTTPRIGSGMHNKKRKPDFRVLDERDKQQPFGSLPGMPVLTSAFHHSPPFNPNGARQGASVFDLRHPAMYQNAFFAEAFEHYQPAMFNYPLFGYGYYPPPGFEMTGFVPLQSQQQPTDSKPVGGEAFEDDEDNDDGERTTATMEMTETPDDHATVSAGSDE